MGGTRFRTSSSLGTSLLLLFIFLLHTLECCYGSAYNSSGISGHSSAGKSHFSSAGKSGHSSYSGSRGVYAGRSVVLLSVVGVLLFLIISGIIAYYCLKWRRQKKSATPSTAAEDSREFDDPSKPPTALYYPTQPSSPAGQPAGYFPMVPQAPSPGCIGQQTPDWQTANPVTPADHPGQPQNAGYTLQPQTAGYPGPPPNNAGDMPYPLQAPGYLPSAPPAEAPGCLPTQVGDQPPPSGVIGFNVPPLPPGGYAPPTQPSSEAPTAPPA